MLNQALLDYYRCPGECAEFSFAGKLSDDSGYFRFGQATCYGQSSAGFRAKQPSHSLYDVLQDIKTNDSAICLPFDPVQIVENLRRERYRKAVRGESRKFSEYTIVRQTYYLLRPLLSVSVRKYLQRTYLRRERHFPDWPVDVTVDSILGGLLALALRREQVTGYRLQVTGGRAGAGYWVPGVRGKVETEHPTPGTQHPTPGVPFIWFWPQGFQSCVIMTHDVEAGFGRDFCSELMDLDESFGFKSSFQIVPEGRYAVSAVFLESIRRRGFEVNVHDLNHDGQLFTSRKEFLRRSKHINRYGKIWGASGFRSGALYREPDWYDAFEFSYDMSIPNSAHLDPQRGGCCTIMPYFIGNVLELPVTTTQDYSLFHILNTYSIDLWKTQIAAITGKHGLVSFIVHPDYIRKQKRALDVYKALLQYLSGLRSEGTIWTALPKDVNDWWRQRSQMKLVYDRGTWQIEGEGKERARIAYASLDGDAVRYTLEGTGNKEHGAETIYRSQVIGYREKVIGGR